MSVTIWVSGRRWYRAVVGAVLAFLIGIATLRLSGVYFVIFTLGLAEMIRTLAWIQNNFTLSRGLRPDRPDRGRHLLYLILAVLQAAGELVASRFASDHLHDETVARHVGINTATSKVILSHSRASLRRLSGAIAPRHTYICRTACLPISFITMALLGGTGRPVSMGAIHSRCSGIINANYSSYSMVMGLLSSIVISCRKVWSGGSNSAGRRGARHSTVLSVRMRPSVLAVLSRSQPVLRGPSNEVMGIIGRMVPARRP